MHFVYRLLFLTGLLMLGFGGGIEFVIYMFSKRDPQFVPNTNQLLLALFNSVIGSMLMLMAYLGDMWERQDKIMKKLGIGKGNEVQPERQTEHGG